MSITGGERPVVIGARGLRKSYSGHEVLRGVDLDLRAGQVLALLGPNGAGKTTLLRILSTATTPDAGTATVAGHDISRERRDVRRQIGIVGQFAAVDETLTGRENLRMIARLRGLSRRRRREAIDLEIDHFDLRSVADTRARQYSGGTRRRLDLAMSLLSRPRVLFLDEPTVGLDPRSRRSLWDRIESLSHDGVAILLTTQYLEEADRLADDIAVIDHGRIVDSGTAAELKQRIGASTLSVRYADSSIETLSTDGSLEALRAHLDRIDAHGRRVEEITLVPPSLDDVFLAITGREGDRT